MWTCGQGFKQGFNQPDEDIMGFNLHVMSCWMVLMIIVLTVATYIYF